MSKPKLDGHAEFKAWATARRPLILNPAAYQQAESAYLAAWNHRPKLESAEARNSEEASELDEYAARVVNLEAEVERLRGDFGKACSTKERREQLNHEQREHAE